MDWCMIVEMSLRTLGYISMTDGKMQSPTRFASVSMTYVIRTSAEIRRCMIQL